MLLIDTNILIDYLRQNPQAVAFVTENGKANLALSPIVVMEVFQGVLNKADFQRTRKVLNGFYRVGFRYFDCSVSDAATATIRSITPDWHP